MSAVRDAGVWTPQPGVKYLVGLDVDGTLVDHDGHLTEAVHDAVRAVVRAGHHVVVATGRSKGATLPIAELAGVDHGYVVSSNGGVTIRLAPDSEGGNTVVDAQVFRPSTALAALHDKIPGAKFALEDAMGRFYSTEQFQDRSFGMEAAEVPFGDLLGMEAVRVVVFSEEIDMDSFTQIVEEAGLHGVTYAVGWTPWLDIAARGVSKATGLEAVRKSLGVAPEHTIALGDGHNDIEMLRWAHRGIAMGQAPEAVKAVADEVTGTVFEDGAVTVLRPLTLSQQISS